MVKSEAGLVHHVDATIVLVLCKERCCTELPASGSISLVELTLANIRYQSQ